MVMSSVDLYTDGSALKNGNSAGGLGYIIQYTEQGESEFDSMSTRTIEGNQGFRLTTNNRMEIMAAIYGINAIIENVQSGTLAGINTIALYSDSAYLCNAINQKWIAKWASNNWMTSGFQGRQPTPVKNKDLWEQIIEIQDKLVNMGISLTVTHVQGHADNALNNRADQLAVAASNASSDQHIIDEAYEKSIANSGKNSNW